VALTRCVPGPAFPSQRRGGSSGASNRAFAAQAEAWPAIKAGRNVLIAAATGSGKTLAAFLAAIDALVRQLIGARTLTNILVGRLFAIFDLQGSTRIAAMIGDEWFHSLLSSIFTDADREMVDHGGEVHSYIGDAMIATARR
jgi:hypothetical protein